MENNASQTQNTNETRTKYCKYCGAVIPQEAVVCTACGRQVEQFNNAQQPNVIINNTNTNTNTMGGRPKSKIVALLLCFFLGFIGAHKFYEGKIGMGVLYLFTFGLCGIGSLIDFIALLFKPSTYYV